MMFSSASLCENCSFVFADFCGVLRTFAEFLSIVFICATLRVPLWASARAVL